MVILGGVRTEGSILDRFEYGGEDLFFGNGDAVDTKLTLTLVKVNLSHTRTMLIFMTKFRSEENIAT